MITYDLEKNPSALLSEWRAELKAFCAAQDFSAAASQDWHATFQSILSRFRAWDFLMVHQISALRELFSEADMLCARSDVPADIKEKVSEFVLRKIRVITELPENRDFAERFFEVRRLLPFHNRFRRIFVSRYIEREACAGVLDPLHEVSDEIVHHEQSVPYIFEAEWNERVKELALSYGEEV